MHMKTLSKTLLFTIAIMPLSACMTTSSPEKVAQQEKPSINERLDAALETAVIATSKDSQATSKLLKLEKQYKNDSENPEIALAYAQALRQAELLPRAEVVLKPFAEEDLAYPGVKTEMSMIALARGNYDRAEKYAQDAVLQNTEDYQAYQNLGIALDAKEMHPEAERAFRKGLENWKGDPTSIMNNLALNLATQGFVDEAIEVLERAKALSPHRVEIERNLRIIRTLNET
ncbi:MAG: tetratricopeptide repeat protein [Alphaproteobacteria bacterium]|nr:tetratricopeptide repeat protein [Alphaproteobacteria bacterium]